MWIDRDGVLHTVALPDPSEVMSEEFLRDLDHLLRDRADEVSELIALEEERLYRELLERPSMSPDDKSFRGLAPPVRLMRSSLITVEDLRTSIQAVPWRWRLDVLTALDDYSTV
jgi:hypothetical protein